MYDLTFDDLNDELRYEPETGHFYWTVKKRGRSRYRPAGTNNSGYRYIKFHGQTIKASWIAVLLMTREWPEGTVVHKDGDGMNTKWENLVQVKVSGPPRRKRATTSSDWT